MTQILQRNKKNDLDDKNCQFWKICKKVERGLSGRRHLACWTKGPSRVEKFKIATSAEAPFIVRGLKNAFLMPLTPLLYRYLTVLWQSSSGSKEELGILVVGWKWLFWCKIHFRTHRIIIWDKKHTKKNFTKNWPWGGGKRLRSA